MCFNLLTEVTGRFYYTLHNTTMSAPFYTSEKSSNPHLKWPELDLRAVQNTSASCIVLRIWQCDKDGTDKIVLTWGVNFSGLVYIGNKIADIQPHHFKNNTVIFYMLGGYFTSHHMIRTDLQKPVPFHSSMNTVNTSNNTVVYKRVAVKVNKNEIHNSYNIQKLRKLQSLQLQIRNKGMDVQNIKDKINTIVGNNVRVDTNSSESTSSLSSTIRYAPQLLTMNSLNKMLQEKPTGVQKQEMQRISKDIELARFRTRVLSQEKDRKTISIRQLKQMHLHIIEENEEKNSELMENYRKLSRGGEKLKDYKKSVSQHKELYFHVIARLQQRKRELLQGLLFLYPIEKKSDNKYTIHGVHLPNSDVLTDTADLGVSVALGYVTHILIMSSAFLHVPLRYQLTHFGSRSYITDTVSPLLSEKERDFPLFTKGKDKAQFTYAVYLLNKNIAQLRWLYFMNTNDLRATLHNLLTFLQGQRESRAEMLSLSEASTSQKPEAVLTEKGKRPAGTPNEKLVSLHSANANSHISDPVLDSMRQETQAIRLCSPTRRPAGLKSISRIGTGGLSEVLTMPEAYLNKQIGVDVLKNFMITNDKAIALDDAASSTASNKSQSALSSLKSNLIKITKGKESKLICDNDQHAALKIERGHDPLNPDSVFSNVASKSIKIKSDSQLCRDERIISQNRISRSMETYNEHDCSTQMRIGTELGSEPQLDRIADSEKRISVSDIQNNSIQTDTEADLTLKPGLNFVSQTKIIRAVEMMANDPSLQKNMEVKSQVEPRLVSTEETIAVETEQAQMMPIMSASELDTDSQLLVEQIFDGSMSNRSVDTSMIQNSPVKARFESDLNSQLESNSAQGMEETTTATTQKEFLEKWMEAMPAGNLYLDSNLSVSPGATSGESPLTARTDALLSTKSFNLVKPK
ncbi:unnamed protein product [Callosobruchus maculatus]|nr:unnamed protein product [Callosobruchus maculatus]